MGEIDWGKVDLVVMVGAMLSKSLNQFSLDGQGSGRCCLMSHTWFMMGDATLNNTVTSREVIFPSNPSRLLPERKKKYSFVLACP